MNSLLVSLFPCIYPCSEIIELRVVETLYGRTLVIMFELAKMGALISGACGSIISPLSPLALFLSSSRLIYMIRSGPRIREGRTYIRFSPSFQVP